MWTQTQGLYARWPLFTSLVNVAIICKFPNTSCGVWTFWLELLPADMKKQPASLGDGIFSLLTLLKQSLAVSVGALHLFCLFIL